VAVFHFSENGGIERFVPRAPLAHPDAEARVWAIDAWHSPLYYFPSDCPRVCFWPLPTTSAEDRARFWLDESLRMVVAIESQWLERLRDAEIYRYEFAEDGFVDCQDHGVYVGASTVTPLSVTPVGPCLEALAKASVELRVCPSLAALAERMMETSFHWSLIRMRNAVGWDHATGRPTMPKG